MAHGEQIADVLVSDSKLVQNGGNVCHQTVHLTLCNLIGHIGMEEGDMVVKVDWDLLNFVQIVTDRVSQCIGGDNLVDKHKWLIECYYENCG